MLGIEYYVKKLLSIFWKKGKHYAITKITSDTRAEQLLSQFLSLMTLTDEAQRILALQQIVHKSLLYTDTNGVTDLNRSIKEFMYRRAVASVQFYQNPVSVYEVQKGSAVTVGTGAGAEHGREDLYFINKKPGVSGRPAPITVFWPDSGAAPSLTNFGSL